MSTIITPPPPPPAPSAPASGPVPPQGPAPIRASSRVVAIIMVALGGLIVLGAIGSAVVSTVFAASVRTSTNTVDTTGVDNLDLDVSSGTLRVEFADVDEAELEVTSAFGSDRWTLRNDEGELVVASPRQLWMGWLFGGSGDGVLRLPQSLAGLDADVQLSAGDLTVNGDFGDLDVDLGAGRMQVEGSAREVNADISAGRADLALADVRQAQLTVSAGELRAILTGRQPTEITADVSAGSLRLTVPAGDYDVTSDVSAGDFDNRIGSTPGASSTVRVSVSAGSAELRSGR